MSVGHLDHVLIVYSSMEHVTWTIDRVKQDIVEKSLKAEAKKAKNTRGKHKDMVVVPLPYVKGLSQASAGKNSEISRHRHS